MSVRRSCRVERERHRTRVEPTTPVLRRASQPMAVPLGTLDAIHLATALLWRETRGLDLVVTTHDRALATAARSHGLRTLGV